MLQISVFKSELWVFGVRMFLLIYPLLFKSWPPHKPDTSEIGHLGKKIKYKMQTCKVVKCKYTVI